jgi:hypothetical protein
MKIKPSQQKITYDKVTDITKDGSEIANAIDVIMDKEFIEQSRHDWCWVGWGEVPKKQDGIRLIETINSCWKSPPNKQRNYSGTKGYLCTAVDMPE